MAKAITAGFRQLGVEIEWVPGSGTYARFCGLTSKGMTRQNNIEESRVPYCEEDRPSAIEKSVESQTFAISGSGVWARQNHQSALDWFYAGDTRNARIFHQNAAVGETEYEQGPALLAALNITTEDGQKVQAEIDIQFDGTPERIAKVA